MLFKKMKNRKCVGKVKTGTSQMVTEKEEMFIESGYLSDSSSRYEEQSDSSIVDFPLQRDYKSDLGR
jgi:hypothetical protein